LLAVLLPSVSAAPEARSPSAGGQHAGV